MPCRTVQAVVLVAQLSGPGAVGPTRARQHYARAQGRQQPGRHLGQSSSPSRRQVRPGQVRRRAPYSCSGPGSGLQAGIRQTSSGQTLVAVGRQQVRPVVRPPSSSALTLSVRWALALLQADQTFAQRCRRSSGCQTSSRPDVSFADQSNKLASPWPGPGQLQSLASTINNSQALPLLPRRRRGSSTSVVRVRPGARQSDQPSNKLRRVRPGQARLSSDQAGRCCWVGPDQPARRTTSASQALLPTSNQSTFFFSRPGQATRCRVRPTPSSSGHRTVPVIVVFIIGHRPVHRHRHQTTIICLTDRHQALLAGRRNRRVRPRAARRQVQVIVRSSGAVVQTVRSGTSSSSFVAALRRAPSSNN